MYVAQASVQVLGMHAFGPSLAEFLLHGAAGEGQPPLVEERAQLVRSGHPDHHRRRIGHVPKALFALAQGRLGALSLGDVLQDIDVILRLIVLVARQRYVQPGPCDVVPSLRMYRFSIENEDSSPVSSRRICSTWFSTSSGCVKVRKSLPVSSSRE